MFSVWSSAPPTKTYKPICSGCKTENGFVTGAINSNYDQYVAATQYLSTGRTDGYDDGYGNTFQGVRAFDENTSQWTAPDAYAGDVRDPMSQKRFMWNNNNPLEYSDPSGYCADPGGSGARVCVEAFIQQPHVMEVMRGDNRGFKRDAVHDSFRARATVDFASHSGHVALGTSHDRWGHAFPAVDHGSFVKVTGNTATVHIDASVGGPMGLGGHAPSVKADFTITLGSSGRVSISGVHTRFPSFEAYSYGTSFGLDWQYTESPENEIGPISLYAGEHVKTPR